MSQADPSQDVHTFEANDELVKPPELDRKPGQASPPFSVFATSLDMILRNRRNPKQTDKKRDIIEKFFNEWRKRVDLDLFPVVRLLLPERDRQRATYGVKEQALAKIICKVLGLDVHKSPDAHRLINWKEPLKDEVGAGDFAETAADVIGKRSTVTSSKHMTIDEVNDHLDQLSRAHNEENKAKVMKVFYERMPASQAKWLIRIILKGKGNLKVSISEKTVLGIFHPDAMDLFNVCSDLKRVCWTLWNPDKRLPREDSDVKPGRPFRPMLCKRNERELQSIIKLMGNEKFVIEEKLDGERIQLHKIGDTYKYVSRKDKDYTYLYGGYRNDGCLTVYVHRAMHPDIEEVILDGEMVVYDPEGQIYMEFGNLKPAALDVSNNDKKPYPCFKVFDILYVKGKGKPGRNLTRNPLKNRKAILRKVFTPTPHRFECADEWEGGSVQDIRERLEAVMENRGEGLVVKRPDSHYVLNGREDTWIKVKPDYMEGLGETMDLCVIGAYWGNGRRGGTLASFFCGVRDDRDAAANEDDNPKYLTFCKVGSGLSVSLSDKIRELTNLEHGSLDGSKWKPTYVKGKRALPSWFQIAHQSPEIPDVWIHPKDSFVLKVKAATVVTQVDGYAAGSTLRFPRMMGIREDLDYTSAMTYKDFRVREVTKRKPGTEMEHQKTKRRKVSRAVKPRILSTLNGADTSGIRQESNVFAGNQFWVVEGTSDYDKATLEKLVHAHGGTFVQTLPRAGIPRVISPRSNILTLKKAMTQNFRVVHPQWVLDSVSRGRILPVVKRYVVHGEADSDDDEEGDDVDMRLDEEKPKPDVKVEDEDVDPVHHEWFSVEALSQASAIRGDRRIHEREDGEDESETEDEVTESETEDEASSRTYGRSAAGDNETHSMEDLPMEGTVNEGQSEISPAFADRESEGIAKDVPEEVLQYDNEVLFCLYRFYLDTREAASRETLPLGDSALSQDSVKFKHAKELIIQNGGKIVTSLDDSMLTHIVVAAEDPSRYRDLVRRTSRPRARHIVTTDWLDECVESDALVEERDFLPPRA